MSTYHGVRTRHGLMTCHDMVVRHDTMTCHDMMTLYGTMPPNNTTTRPKGRTAVRRPGHGQMVSSGEMSYPVSNCRAGVRWPHWGEGRCRGFGLRRGTLTICCLLAHLRGYQIIVPAEEFRPPAPSGLPRVPRVPGRGFPARFRTSRLSQVGLCGFAKKGLALSPTWPERSSRDQPGLAGAPPSTRRDVRLRSSRSVIVISFDPSAAI